ncbi:hypothetical protein LOTGIDRAFT_138889 [Lottia gigantea]|uniref:Calpain catalytic domain-containing protein n=1 Tax=Lottia gigantea TaxID=225164 RepID=V4AD60_LOTGI|nr:hypothetical protein LOTGIDRAFT_138889 [Lottia gigantea]ESP01924.1 hypothetical protein LOTGIDRAFT_138889 [Lottia gigantea]
MSGDPYSGVNGVIVSELEKDGISMAKLAVQCDLAGKYDTALFYYVEAAQALFLASQAGSKIPNILGKVQEYTSRAEQLKQMGKSSSPFKSDEQLNVDRAKFLLNQGFDEDEAGNTETAIDLYKQAVELFIKIKNGTTDSSLQSKMTELATQALDRAEELKKKPDLVSTMAATKINPTPRRVIPGPLGFLDPEDDPSISHPRSPSQPKQRNSGSGGYTKDEIAVLRNTSFINGREYVPFMDVDTKDRFALPVTFSDKDGKLALSPKQHRDFSRWVRPDEFCDDPKMIFAVSSFSIKQTVVSDCSFVASLAISAQYERRFKKKLITSIIYPQNKNGEPIYNPCGKYMVKLHINGVPRKVVIDDFLPMGKRGELLCSFSNNKNELWVSLLEKAYMKVMGGYDFPGSNSNIDLNALTGWIPERVAIRLNSPEFDKEKEFKRLLDRFHKGHCLVSVATGEISEAEGERAGLVPTHAYAMLDIREVKGKKLFMLKNPWNHLRWKGRYSENDDTSWTPELQKTLNYDPKSAQLYDNGVFWIDYESICRFYDVFYINWNPDLFSHTTCLHNTWSAKSGPKKDSYNISDNPQYRLEIKSPESSAVWILLTRHITDKADFADNKEFITVLVYKTGGNQVFYPYDPPPYKDGVKINSPHYLCKLVEPKGTSLYTLVISQYEKNNTIRYTLRVYSTAEFKLTKFTDPYLTQFEKHINGKWSTKTAGGCSNYPDTHKNNPIYQIKIDNNRTDNSLLIELRAYKSYSVGIQAVCVTDNVPNSPGSIKKKPSGDFRPGYCVLQLNNLPGGVYNIMPCTFRPGQEGDFFLDISSSVPYSISHVQ